jgi:hypothetical protein
LPINIYQTMTNTIKNCKALVLKVDLGIFTSDSKRPSSNEIQNQINERFFNLDESSFEFKRIEQAIDSSEKSINTDHIANLISLTKDDLCYEISPYYLSKTDNEELGPLMDDSENGYLSDEQIIELDLFFLKR